MERPIKRRIEWIALLGAVLMTLNAVFDVLDENYILAAVAAVAAVLGYAVAFMRQHERINRNHG